MPGSSPSAGPPPRTPSATRARTARRTRATSPRGPRGRRTASSATTARRPGRRCPRPRPSGWPTGRAERHGAVSAHLQVCLAVRPDIPGVSPRADALHSSGSQRRTLLLIDRGAHAPRSCLRVVRPVSQTPTEVTDYAALSALYGTLLGTTAIIARRREAIPRDELPALAAATFALSKLVVHEKVETWVREPFVEEHPDGRRPKGRRLRYAIGELLTCTRCTGAWGSLALVALRLHSPAAGRIATTVLATSAGNDFLQTGFSYLCSLSNRTQYQ